MQDRRKVRRVVTPTQAPMQRILHETVKAVTGPVVEW